MAVPAHRAWLMAAACIGKDSTCTSSYAAAASLALVVLSPLYDRHAASACPCLFGPHTHRQHTQPFALQTLHAALRALPVALCSLLSVSAVKPLPTNNLVSRKVGADVSSKQGGGYGPGGHYGPGGDMPYGPGGDGDYPYGPGGGDYPYGPGGGGEGAGKCMA